MAKSIDKTELFARTPVPKALRTMAIPTIVSQLINLVYNVVDTFFIGRTGNSFMVAATTIAFTLVMMMTALSNLFGIGGGSHVARLMGAGHSEKAKSVSSFCLYASILMALAYSALIGLFLEPLLKFFGASDQTLGFAKSYTVIVIVIGALPGILSIVRELVIYIPFMFILNIPFGEIGLAASLPAGEACSAVFAFWLLTRALKERRLKERPLA